MYQHLTKLLLAGVGAVALLAIGIFFQAQFMGQAIGQTTRCPCFNEMMIAGACGHIDTCLVFRFGEAVPKELRCPTEATELPPNWSFTAGIATSRQLCSLSTGRGAGVVQEITVEEEARCRQVLESADLILGCEDR